MRRVIYSGFGLLLIAAAFFAFNLFASVAFKNVQLDLTDQKLYTLTDGTQQLLNSLDEPIDLFFFYSSQAARDLPQVRQYAQRVQELLEAYVARSNGQIRLQRIEPQAFSEEEDLAAELGLHAIQLLNGETLYLGLAGKNHREELHSIAFFSLEQEALLEYELSRLLHVLTQVERPVVGVMSGLPLQGGYDAATGQYQPAWRILDEVRQQFQLEALEPTADFITDDIAVLWLIHPQGVSETALLAIDQFVLRGGKVLAFIEPDTDSGVSQLLEAWGVELQALSSSMLQLSAGALNRQDVITAPLNTIALQSAGRLVAAENARTHLEPLLKNSPRAFAVAPSSIDSLHKPAQLLPQQNAVETADTLAARVIGAASTAFPEGVNAQVPAITESEAIQVVVVADTDMLRDELWLQVEPMLGMQSAQAWTGNAGFVLSALDNLSSSDALLDVRSRDQFSRPFTMVERLRRVAHERYAEKELLLQQRLAIAEQQLFELQGREMTATEKAAMQASLQERLELRKQLRDVQYQLNANIESLGTWVKVFNIAVMPFVLTFAMVVIGLQRRIRRIQLD